MKPGLWEQFGGIPLRMYLQGAYNVRRRWAAKFPTDSSAKLQDDKDLIGPEARGRFHELPAVTLITGEQNQLWHRDSINRMHEWITAGLNRRARERFMKNYHSQLRASGPALGREEVVGRGLSAHPRRGPRWSGHPPFWLTTTRPHRPRGNAQRVAHQALPPVACVHQLQDGRARQVGADHRRTASDPSLAPIGSADPDCFEQRAHLGAGGTGNVSLAFDRLMMRWVALKTLHAHPKALEDRKRYFLQEARLTGQLDHPEHRARV